MTSGPASGPRDGADPRRPPSAADRDRYQAIIDAWFTEQAATNPAVDAIERDVFGPRQWFVRLLSEAKGPFTIRFELDQRTLRFETYFCPAPEENQAEFFNHLLVRNRSMYGGSFSVGEEGAIFLQGRLGLSHGELIDPATVDVELDRVLGSLFFWTEEYFRPAMRIGYASRFKG